MVPLILGIILSVLGAIALFVSLRILRDAERRLDSSISHLQIAIGHENEAQALLSEVTATVNKYLEETK